MHRRVFGGITFLRHARNPAFWLSAALNRFDAHFPESHFTHVSGSYDLQFNYIPYSKDRIETLLKSDYSNLQMAQFSSGSPVDDAVAYELEIAVRGIELRASDFGSLAFNFSQSFYATYASQILRFLDDIAAGIGAEGGDLHDSEDSFNQNQSGPHWFKLIGQPVPRTKLKWDTYFNEEVIDLEQNPCHTHMVGLVDFTAAWTNYLGPTYLRHLGLTADEVKEAVSDIAYEVVVLGDSLIRVTLFEDPFEYEHPDNVERMWTYRRRLQIDEVAHALLPDSEKPSRFVPLPN